jgi:hypothetical protein
MTKKEPIGKLKQAIKEETPIALHFETARDLVLFQLQELKQQVKDIEKKTGVDHSGDISSIEDTYNFFKSTITSLKIYRNQEENFPYSYDVDFILRENESKEDIEKLVKEYLISDTFNLILARLDPNVLNILIQIEKQKEDLKQIEKRLRELSKKKKALQKDLEKKETGKGKFRRSGHLTDQILKYNYPKDNSSQLPIFQSLKSETLNDIKVSGIEVAQIVEGIKLSPSETKVIDCLCKLLHETSQTLDAKKEDYYSGNMSYELVEYGGDKNIPAPKLAFTLYELTKEYTGDEKKVGGKDIENVKQILTELDNKRFLLSYVETTKKKDGGRIERKIEDFKKLLHIVRISQTEYSKEDVELSKQEETVIILNPIFRRQIDSKFILYPNDINRRTIIAYGSHNLSEIALKLRDYLIRELSSKRYNPEIGMDRLYYLLSEKWMKESRKKKVKEYTEKALETVKTLGLLLSYEIKTDTKGEAKMVFKLNKDWE